MSTALELKINDLAVPIRSGTLTVEDQWGERSDLRVQVDDFEREFSFENFNHVTLDRDEAQQVASTGQNASTGAARPFPASTLVSGFRATARVTPSAGPAGGTTFPFFRSTSEAEFTGILSGYRADARLQDGFEAEISGEHGLNTDQGWLFNIAATTADETFALRFQNDRLRFTVRTADDTFTIQTTQVFADGDEFVVLAEYDPVAGEIRLRVNGIVETPVAVTGLLNLAGGATRLAAFQRSRFPSADRAFLGDIFKATLVADNVLIAQLDPTDTGFVSGAIPPGSEWEDDAGETWEVGENLTIEQATNARLINIFGTADDEQVFSIHFQADGRVRFIIRTDDDVFAIDTVDVVQADGVEVEIVAEYDAAVPEIRLSIDGVPEPDLAVTGVLNGGTLPLAVFNRDEPNVDNVFVGVIGEAAVLTLVDDVLAEFVGTDIANGLGPIDPGTTWTDQTGATWTAGTDLEVELTAAATREFEGFIQDAKAKVVQLGDPDQVGWIWTIDSFDNVYRADKRLVVRGYQDMTAGEIARSLVDGTGPGGPHPDPLGEEGVTVGVIDLEFGPVYPNVSVNYAKVSKLLDALGQSARGVWNIDEARALNFHPYDTVPGNPPGLDEVLTPAEITSRNPRYRNQQIVRGGHDQTSVQVEEFESPTTADQATYVVSYPLALEPGIEVNGVPQTVGIRGLDQSGFDWYWNKNSNVVTADDPGSIGPNQPIVVTYTGLYDALVRTANPIEIDNQADREDSPNSGTTGLVEEIEVTADYDTISDAITIAGTLLIAWSQTSGEAKFTTDQAGLVPGQVIEIDLPAPTQGMDPDRFTDPTGGAAQVTTEFTIRTVETFDLDGINLRYRITAIRDAQVGTWRSFWSDALDPFDEDQNLFINTTEIDILVIVESFDEDWTWNEDVVQDVFACPVPALTLFPDPGLLPC